MFEEQFEFKTSVFSYEKKTLSDLYISVKMQLGQILFTYWIIKTNYLSFINTDQIPERVKIKLGFINLRTEEIAP